MRDRSLGGGPSLLCSVEMKKLLALMVMSLFLSCGCSALSGAHFITKDGKDSPFKGRDDRHELHQDPYGRY
jgi:hypothetical protein